MTTAAARAPGASASSPVEQALAGELGQGIVRGHDEQRPAGMLLARVGRACRQRGHDPVGGDRGPSRSPQRDRLARLTSDVLVTIRYGMPAPVELRERLAVRRRRARPSRTITPSRSRSSARTPDRAARSRSSGVLGEDRSPQRTGCTLRAGWDCSTASTRSIFGVANDHSIAWGIAQAFHEQGATVGFTSVESLIEKRVRPLATSIGSTFVEPCDVQSDEQIRARLREMGRRPRPARHPGPRPGVRPARGPRR